MRDERDLWECEKRKRLGVCMCIYIHFSPFLFLFLVFSAFLWIYFFFNVLLLVVTIGCNGESKMKKFSFGEDYRKHGNNTLLFLLSNLTFLLLFFTDFIVSFLLLFFNLFMCFETWLTNEFKKQLMKFCYVENYVNTILFGFFF